MVEKQKEKQNAPVKKVRMGNVEVCMWETEQTNQAGETFMSKSITAQKSYKDKDDKWQNSQNFNINEAFKLERALRLMLDETLRYNKDEE